MSERAEKFVDEAEETIAKLFDDDPSRAWSYLLAKLNGKAEPEVISWEGQKFDKTILDKKRVMELAKRAISAALLVDVGVIREFLRYKDNIRRDVKAIKKLEEEVPENEDWAERAVESSHAAAEIKQVVAYTPHKIFESLDDHNYLYARLFVNMVKGKFVQFKDKELEHKALLKAYDIIKQTEEAIQ